MKKLSFISCEQVSQLVWPEHSSELNLHSNALAFVTDFKLHCPLVIEQNTRAIDAEYMMKKAHVKLKFVVDEHNQFIGIVSFADLNNQEIIKKVATGDDREDLIVSDFMRTKANLAAIEWQDIEKVTIRNLLQQLSDFNDQHLLLTDDNGTALRGIISAADVARDLHLPVDINSRLSFRMISSLINSATKFVA